MPSFTKVLRILEVTSVTNALSISAVVYPFRRWMINPFAAQWLKPIQVYLRIKSLSARRAENSRTA